MNELNPPRRDICSMANQQNSDEKLRQLVCQTCQYKPRSIQRRKSLNRLVYAIIKSGKLWQESTPYYEDALQQTWLYLCRNLCEKNTGEKYNPEKSSVTTWLDRYLKKRLLDFRLLQCEENNRNAYQSLPNSKNQTNPMDNLPAPSDIPPILEEIESLVKSDPNGELGKLHIKCRPDLTCQVLILRRLPPETDWKSLAEEFDCSISTLANFYQRNCFPCLRKFGESEGYL